MYGDLHDRLALIEHRLSALEVGQGRILDELRGLRHLGESIMAATQDLKQVIGELKDETDKVAVRLDKTIKQLESGVGPDDTAAAIADLKVIRDHMHEMGTDPANPVPPLPPEPPPPAAGARGPKQSKS